MAEQLLDIQELSLTFHTPAGKIEALNGVSLSMKKGERLGIVGESGSGKSVTAYSVMGLTAGNGEITNGNIYFDGKHMNALSEKELRLLRGNEVSIVFQDPMTSLNPVFSIGNQLEEGICLHLGISRKEARKKARELLHLVGINEPEQRLRQYPHQLSGGMRQRIMIAMALSCEPKLLIADEPTTALDVTIQAQILQLIQELCRKKGMAVLFITHDLGIVAEICEKVAVMYAGRVVEYGTVEEIFYQPRHEYTKGLIKSLPRMDSEAKERLVPIKGTPVDLSNLPCGCPFSERCDCCMAVCREKMPPAFWFSETHFARCWMGRLRG